MKKIILTYGIIGGLIPAVWFLISEGLLPDSVSLNIRLWLGYTSMILAFATIFVAVKKYRDNFGDGFITFGKALRIGLLVTLVASTLYVVVWLISYPLFFPNYFEKYMAMDKRQMLADGKNAAEIGRELAEMAKYRELYKNPVFNILVTYSEIVPVGIVISLIAALILKNKPKPAATNA